MPAEILTDWSAVVTRVKRSKTRTAIPTFIRDDKGNTVRAWVIIRKGDNVNPPLDSIRTTGPKRWDNANRGWVPGSATISRLSAAILDAGGPRAIGKMTVTD